MKKVFLFVFIAFTLNAKAQFALEHTYDSAAVWNTCSGNINQLMLVKFEVSGEHYVRINRCGHVMSIYDLNHAFVKNISLAGVPLNPPYYIVEHILYLSENLFDLDPGIEFMYVSDSGGFYTTKIYDENGSVLFTDNGAPFIKMNIHLQQYPIYNTSAGTKMILSYENGQAKVFGLAGTLSTAIQETNDDLMNERSLISNPYPNPAKQSTTVDYKLPGDINEGEIVFYNLTGKEIKRFKVDKTFNSLLISTIEISAGTYYYQLQTSEGASGGKKLVVVK
ncbi:MAG TPA: T9SS type A sorting domain-containing protein [Bacteroidia bacterium]|nr:T9SS type A sorting domain-containing protein [Bacteroidia bacterium]